MHLLSLGYLQTSLLRWFLPLLALLISASVYATDDYRVSSIPAELTQDANAIIRNQKEQFIIHSVDKATYQLDQAITILNKNGDGQGLFAVFYDPQRKVKNVQCIIYDAFGKEIKKVKSKEINDVSAFSSFSIYEDNRVKYFDYNAAQYPYTIAYSYEIEHDGLLDYRDWIPIDNFHVSVEKATFSVVAPASLPIRYHLQHSSEPKTWSEEGQQFYQWELENHPAIGQEKLRPNLFSIVPQVQIAPVEFSYEGYTGNQDSWQKIGEWINTLNEGRDQLPVTTQQEIKSLISGVTDTTEIIRNLYEYMQSKTRYVSIQLGIGGFQPFPAETVNRLGYGDCKALSNYMKSILAIAGIDSRYTLVNAGSSARKVIADFPSLQFNHAILGVPLAQDTIWLECTSQTRPSGFLGDFTDDRYVLMVDEAGGKLAKTPAYSASDNQQIRNITLSLDDTGNGKLLAKTHYSGQLYDDIANITRLNEGEQKQAVYQQVDIPNFRITQFEYNLDKKRLPVATETMAIEVDRYASVSGKRWFFSPNVMTHLERLPANTEERTHPIVIRQAYTEIDTIVIQVPESLYPEFTPEATEISSMFGSYRSEYRIDQGSIVYIRRFIRNRGTFASESYKELLNFYQKVAKTDRQQIVLRKAT
ncbi:MAG: DUF3857 domain-containing protein [Bacteroidota bacterium]